MKYFTVGPTQPYPKFRAFLDDALAQDIVSLSHRSEKFYGIIRQTRDALVPLLRVPDDRLVFYAGSATEWMERAAQNLCAERSLHFVSGTFGERFYAFAQEMGRDAYKVRPQEDGSFSLEDVPAAFSPEMIAITHNETSDGTQVPEGFLAEVRARFPDALFAVDVVSSAPMFPDTFAQADFLFFSVQKGFGLPAGLGVALASPRAVEKSAAVAHAGLYTGGFHALANLAKDAAKDRTPETPNVLGIFLLNAVARDMLAIGVKRLQADTREKAAILYAALAAAEGIELDPIREECRSQTTIVAATPGSSKPIIERLKAEGFQIHSGYGEKKETHIRIANFAAHPVEDVKRLASLL